MSAGERQLLCFARALVLENNRIVVLDEPSSALDAQTDAIVLDLVQTELRLKRHCTILTIAHRLETVIECDRILVMKEGTVLEYDRPLQLLQQDPKSEFRHMVESSNNSAHLLRLAYQAGGNTV